LYTLEILTANINLKDRKNPLKLKDFRIITQMTSDHSTNIPQRDFLVLQVDVSSQYLQGEVEAVAAIVVDGPPNTPPALPAPPHILK